MPDVRARLAAVSPSPPALVAETTRTTHAHGELVESRHHGHVVVVDGDGGLLASAGDPQRLTFARSAVKPFQATAALELLGDAGGLSDAEVAVAWASHRGEPCHLDEVRRLLARGGLGEDALTTPPEPPMADWTSEASAITHNCSGKHALFALTGEAIGCPRDERLDPDGPLQRHVLGVLAEALDVGDPPVAVDGCGAPAVAVPLANLARAYADLADPDGRWARVAAAGLAHPLLVGGEGRLESALLGAGVVAKPGAEGVFAAAWRTTGGERRGCAVKIEDGASRAASVVLHALLVEAGAITADVWSPPPVLGGGRPTGRVRGVAALTGLGAGR